MQQYSGRSFNKNYSHLAQVGASIVQSNVKPFLIDNQPIISSKNASIKQTYPRIVNASYNSSALINKLTLKRLRKMQALVRGFLVRRITYPRLLKRYRICQKVYESISKNSIFQQSSAIVMDLISQNKVKKDLILESKSDKILLSLTNTLMSQFIEEISKQVIATCISQNIQKNNPQIKALTQKTTSNIFQLHLPQQRVAKQIIYSYIDKISQGLARQVIKQTVNQLRIQKLADQYILQEVLLMPMIQEVYQEYINQIFIQQIGQRIVNESMQQFSQALVKYQVQKHNKRQQQFEAKQAQKNLLDLIVGQQLLTMLINQQ